MYIYQFYSDLEEHNKMDTIHFWNLTYHIRKETVEELKLLEKMHLILIYFK